MVGGPIALVPRYSSMSPPWTPGHPRGTSQGQGISMAWWPWAHRTSPASLGHMLTRSTCSWFQQLHFKEIQDVFIEFETQKKCIKAMDRPRPPPTKNKLAKLKDALAGKCNSLTGGRTTRDASTSKNYTWDKKVGSHASPMVFLSGATFVSI